VKGIVGAIIVTVLFIMPRVASAQCVTQFIAPAQVKHACPGLHFIDCQIQLEQEWHDQIAIAQRKWQQELSECQARQAQIEQQKRQAAAQAAAAEAERQRQENQRRIDEQNAAAQAQAERDRRQQPILNTQLPSTQPGPSSSVSRPQRIQSDADIERSNRLTVIVLAFVIAAIAILWFSRHAMARKLRASSANSRINQVSTSNKTQWGETNRKNEEERFAQLRTLRDAVPHSPPQRMRATIHYNTFKTPVFATRYFEGQSAEEQTGVDTRYAVDLILELSEEERGIVVQNDLHTIVLDDKPLYSKDDLAKRRRAEIERAESMGGRGELDLIMKEITKQSADAVAAIAEVHRAQTLVGDFLVAPFTKTFDHAHDAKQYGDELTTEILPGIRKLIESYRGHSERPVTMEF